MPEATVIEDKIEFINAEEAEKIVRMMEKDWVKKDAKPKDLKEFVYRIISCHPYEKSGQYPPADKFLVKGEVQKFYRHKFVEQKFLVSGQENTQKVNQKVEQFQYNDMTDSKFNPGGSWNMVDGDANRQIDFSVFLKEFTEDKSE